MFRNGDYEYHPSSGPIAVGPAKSLVNDNVMPSIKSPVMPGYLLVDALS